MKLFMIMLGCSVEGRHTEQHDIFFGIGEQLADLKADMEKFWAGPELHIDAWREVTRSNGYEISVVERKDETSVREANLYFINLGGYRENEFDELHYKMLVVAADQHLAVKKAKESLFFKETGFKGAAAHIDDKYGVDVDDLYNVEDILPAELKKKYSIMVSVSSSSAEDNIHLGYLPLNRL